MIWIRAQHKIGSIPTHRGKHEKAAILKTAFHVHFIDWVYSYFDPNVTKVCSWECSWQYVSIGLCNGLAPKWWQAITWNIDNPIPRRIYATVDINVFKGTVKQNARSVKHVLASVHMGILLSNTLQVVMTNAGHIGLRNGTVNGLWKFPLVTWAHSASLLGGFPTYI